MSAIRWNPDQLLNGADHGAGRLSDLIRSAQHGRQMKVLVERADSERLLRGNGRSDFYQAQFRRGCVGIVQARMATSAQRSRVISEIHRRLDRLSKSNASRWEEEALSIYDYACAWALAGEIDEEGFSVCVIEASEDRPNDASVRPMDVEIILPSRRS